ncbi:MAG: NAD(P)-binding domain-containing protein [Rubrobacter sp.]|nr:NAD(P)-binding domain-containing protein [Rubrobacter sp.]
MNIGIIGAGNIGANAARLFADARHRVAISNSRGPESLSSLVEEIGANASAVSVEEAAGFGEVVLVAIPFGRYETLPAAALADKLVIDATNYYPGRDGQLDLGGRTSSEVMSGHLPLARVVKAFNTMYYETLRTRGSQSYEDRLVLFVAGDDVEAKAVVSGLVDEIGFAPVDTGSLRDGGGKQELGSPIYNEPMSDERAREILSGIS